MKIKFEIKLTASRALLAVLSALVGISVQAEEKKEVFAGEKADAPQALAGSQGITPVESAPGQEKPRTTRTRNQAPKADPIPEKIIPPAPIKAEETIEQEETPNGPGPDYEPGVAITIEEVRGFGGSLIQKNDVKFRPMVMAVLQAHGTSKFSELDPAEFAGTLADLKALQ